MKGALKLRRTGEERHVGLGADRLEALYSVRTPPHSKRRKAPYIEDGPSSIR